MTSVSRFSIFRRFNDRNPSRESKQRRNRCCESGTLSQWVFMFCRMFWGFLVYLSGRLSWWRLFALHVRNMRNNLLQTLSEPSYHPFSVETHKHDVCQTAAELQPEPRWSETNEQDEDHVINGRSCVRWQLIISSIIQAGRSLRHFYMSATTSGLNRILNVNPLW